MTSAILSAGVFAGPPEAVCLAALPRFPVFAFFTDGMRHASSTLGITLGSGSRASIARRRGAMIAAYSSSVHAQHLDGIGRLGDRKIAADVEDLAVALVHEHA